MGALEAFDEMQCKGIDTTITVISDPVNGDGIQTAIVQL